MCNRNEEEDDELRLLDPAHLCNGSAKEQEDYVLLVHLGPVVRKKRMECNITHHYWSHIHAGVDEEQVYFPIFFK